jgi:predicted ATPase with chaperone activity
MYIPNVGAVKNYVSNISGILKNKIDTKINTTDIAQDLTSNNEIKVPSVTAVKTYVTEQISKIPAATPELYYE